jgi:two-component system response regulator RegA
MIRAPKRLLIAEDDRSFRDTLAVEFRERHYEVTSVGSVSEFENQACKRFDLAVIDLKLGPESGLTLLERLLDESPKVRAVVLTGYGSIATAVKAVKLGAANYLAKPASIEQIESALLDQQSDSEPEDFNVPSLARHEREYIEYVLERCQGNISKAAKELGIHRQSLQRKLRKYPPRT